MRTYQDIWDCSCDTSQKIRHALAEELVIHVVRHIQLVCQCRDKYGKIKYANNHKQHHIGGRALYGPPLYFGEVKFSPINPTIADSTLLGR